MAGDAGLCQFELYCQQLVDTDLEDYKKEVQARGGKNMVDIMKEVDPGEDGYGGLGSVSLLM